MMGVPALGVFIEVEDPDSGHVWTPDPIDVTGQPTVNDRPGIEITVPQRDRWRKLVENNPDTQVPLRVWEDGQRRPIDSLDNVRDQPDRSVLVGSGGRELRRRVSTTVDQQPVHELVTDLVTSETSYAANVDTPPTTTDDDVQLRTISAAADWRSVVDANPQQPFAVDGSTDSLDLLDAGVGSNVPSSAVTNDGWREDLSLSGHPDGNALVTQSDSAGDVFTLSISPAYDIPAQHVRLGVFGEYQLNEDDDESFPDIAVRASVDGTVIDDDIAVSGGSAAWRGSDASDLGTLSPDQSYTARFESYLPSGSFPANGWRIGGVILYDDRYLSRSALTTNTPVPSPSKPDSAEIVVEQTPAPQAVTGARADTSAAVEGLAVSNDQGDTFPVTASDTASVEGTFTSPAFGPGVTVRLELGRASATSLDSLTLYADLSTMPLVVNKTVSGTLAGILARYADQTNSLWEFRRDGGTESVEWTKAGQRTTDADPALSGYEYEVKTTDVVNEAIVFGRSQQQRTERVTANHGTAVDLAHREIHEGSEVVRNPETGARYTNGPDYALDEGTGTITTKADGEIPDGTLLEIDYQFQARGSYANGNETPATSKEFELPSLTTQMTCSQAARIIVDNLETPLREATATAPPEEIGWTVVEEIDPSDLPGSGLKVRTLEPTPQDLSFRLGSRRSASELIGDLRGQLSTVSRRT
jgi:hypothetical protein